MGPTGRPLFPDVIACRTAPQGAVVGDWVFPEMPLSRLTDTSVHVPVGCLYQRAIRKQKGKRGCREVVKFERFKKKKNKKGGGGGRV